MKAERAMKKNKNASKILIALVSAFFVIGMVLATLYDFEISLFSRISKRTKAPFP